MSQVWFITGANRGLGAEIAKAALAAGNQVVATARRPENISEVLGTSEHLHSVALDVTKADQVEAAVTAAKERFGRIDVLVNNAGYGHLGVFEETPLEEIRAQFETNVFGLMAVTQAVVPGMREQRSGRIFNISSVAGLKAVFGSSIYASSKFAVEGFSQGLAEELAPFGVYVTCVAPGFFRTDFLDPSSAKYGSGRISHYAEPWAAFMEFHENRNHRQAGDPAELGRVLVQLAQAENPPVAFVAGSDAISWAESSMQWRQEQINAWRELSVSTDGSW